MVTYISILTKAITKEGGNPHKLAARRNYRPERIMGNMPPSKLDPCEYADGEKGIIDGNDRGEIKLADSPGPIPFRGPDSQDALPANRIEPIFLRTKMILRGPRRRNC